MAISAQDPVLVALKERARQTWASGNYDAVADGIWEVGARIVERVAVQPGERVLDVAAGTGNAATRAAASGGQVTALDLTPELFEAGRRRAAEAGVEIEWVEGDAEQLPFPDASFDVVLSTFGVMFAPRHRVAAAEMARVLRRAGRLGIAAWAPDGSVGHMFRTVSAELPPPPEIAEAPLAWADPAHVEEIFGGSGMKLAFERETLSIDPDADIDDATAFYVESFGPLITARRILTEQGRWESLAAKLPDVIRRMLTEPAAYITITGTKH